MSRRFDPLSLLDIPVEVVEANLYGLFGRVHHREKEGRPLRIEVRGDLQPHQKMAVLAHEVAHVICHSDAAGGARERLTNRVRRQTRDTGLFYTPDGRELDPAKWVDDVYQTLEDARVEYQLVRDNPAALPYVATCRMLQCEELLPFPAARYMSFDRYMKAAGEAIFRIVRFGEVPGGWEWLFRSLAPRLILHVRSRWGEGAVGSVRLAEWLWSLVLEYAVRNVQPMPDDVPAGNPDRKKGEGEKDRASDQGSGSGEPDAATDAQDDVLPDDFEPDRSDEEPETATNPWGAMPADRTAALARDLASMVSASDFAEILAKQPGLQRHFATTVRDLYADEIAALADLLFRLQGREVTRTRDGDVDLKRQVEAYLDSFLTTEPERLVYRRRRDIPVRADILCVRDVSGSMYGSTDIPVKDPLPASAAHAAAAQLCVALYAFQAHDLRVAVVDVGTHIWVMKGFDESLDAGMVFPDWSGGLTNVHLLFERWHEVVERCGRWAQDSARYVLIISDGDWPWSLMQNVGGPDARVLPVIVRDYVGPQGSTVEQIRQRFGVVFRDVLSAFEYVVKEVTGCRL